MYTKRAVESQRVLLASLFFSVICPEGMVRDGSYVHGVFHRKLQVEKGENVCQEIREKV